MKLVRHFSTTRRLA